MRLVDVVGDEMKQPSLLQIYALKDYIAIVRYCYTV